MNTYSKFKNFCVFLPKQTLSEKEGLASKKRILEIEGINIIKSTDLYLKYGPMPQQYSQKNDLK